MKLGVYRNYDLSVYGDLDINVEDYVKWLDGNKPTRENLQEYIDEDLDFNSELSVVIWNNSLDYDIESSSDISFSGAIEYKLLLNEVEKLQNELKEEN